MDIVTALWQLTIIKIAAFATFDNDITTLLPYFKLNVIYGMNFLSKMNKLQTKKK